MRHAREDAPDVLREPVERPPAVPRAPSAERVLALQRSAGNRAVTAMVARQAGDTELAEKAGDSGAQGARVESEGLGTIALDSVNLGGGGDQGGGGGKLVVSAIALTSRVGEHSARLTRAVAEGTAFDLDIVIPRGKTTMRVKLKGAMVTSYSVSGGEGGQSEAWSLNVQSFEVVQEGSTEEEAPGGWDTSGG